MADFLELIETIRGDQASPERLFGTEGLGIRTGARGHGPEYQRRLVEAVNLIADAYSGKRRAMLLFQEALSTSDFPLYFGDVIDRQVLAGYREWSATYQNYCAVKTVPDFRTVNRFAFDGAESVLSVVPQGDEYGESAVNETRYQYAVAKYGRKLPFLWETIVNDDLDALRDAPARLGRAARRTEEKFASGLFVDASGPHASFYTVGNKNIVNATNSGAPFTAVNPALSITGLQQGFAVLAKMLDADGEPIVVDSVELVVPPGLEITALNILNALELRTDAAVGGGGITGGQLVTTNWMKNRLRLNVNPYIPIIASTANGNTSWFLFANPAVSRPAVEIGLLRGHAEPETFMKSPNSQRVGGGSVDPMDGDFDSDAIAYKVRHVLGGVREDPKATVASNGSGS